MVQKLNRAGSGKTVVGLTGTFGSGKSTVAHMFEELGAAVIDADKLAHEALMKGSSVYDKIKSLFKSAKGGSDEDLDRKKIASIVFRDTELRKQLEKIIHPYVFERVIEEIADTAENVILIEVPLLFETGFEQYCSHTIVVNAPEKKIAERLKETGFAPEEIKARQNAQMPLQEKIKRANFVIDNSANFHETRREVEKIWKKLHTVSKGAA